MYIAVCHMCDTRGEKGELEETWRVLSLVSAGREMNGIRSRATQIVMIS